LAMYQGNEWYDEQVYTVVNTLLDRRTVGMVYNDTLPLGRSYLFVRCRDASSKLRSEIKFSVSY
jgi:hypothetical protein